MRYDSSIFYTSFAHPRSYGAQNVPHVRSGRRATLHGTTFRPEVERISRKFKMSRGLGRRLPDARKIGKLVDHFRAGKKGAVAAKFELPHKSHDLLIRRRP